MGRQVRPGIEEVASRLARIRADLELENSKNMDTLLSNTELLHQMLPPRVAESVRLGRKV